MKNVQSAETKCQVWRSNQRAFQLPLYFVVSIKINHKLKVFQEPGKKLTCTTFTNENIYCKSAQIRTFHLVKSSDLIGFTVNQKMSSFAGIFSCKKPQVIKVTMHPHQALAKYTQMYSESSKRTQQSNIHKDGRLVSALPDSK